MFKLISVGALVLLTASLALVYGENRPPDDACIVWKSWSYYQNSPDPSQLIGKDNIGWVMQLQGDPMACTQRGNLIPCYTDKPSIGSSNAFGHHDYNAFYIPNDYCRIWDEATQQVVLAENFYLPFRTEKELTWKLVQEGSPTPARAVQYSGKIMAMSTTPALGHCAGRGFTGWAISSADGTISTDYFSIVHDPVTSPVFKIAYCKDMTTTLPPHTLPPSTPSPPDTNRPYIRFGNTVPNTERLTCTITQGAISHTWKDYAFGQFSTWVNVFKIGDGEIKIYDSAGKLLTTYTRLLTPGPLIVVTKGYLPLNPYSSVETIAASYVPRPAGESGARLINLSPDTVSAGMMADGKIICNNVSYSLGTRWTTLKADETYTFTVFDDQTSTVLASDRFETPSHDQVFTNVLIGMRNVSKSSGFTTRLVPLLDAPNM